MLNLLAPTGSSCVSALFLDQVAHVGSWQHLIYFNLHADAKNRFRREVKESDRRWFLFRHCPMMQRQVILLCIILSAGKLRPQHHHQANWHSHHRNTTLWSLIKIYSLAYKVLHAIRSPEEALLCICLKSHPAPVQCVDQRWGRGAVLLSGGRGSSNCRSPHTRPHLNYLQVDKDAEVRKMTEHSNKRVWGCEGRRGRSYKIQGHPTRHQFTRENSIPFIWTPQFRSCSKGEISLLKHLRTCIYYYIYKSNIYI